MKERTGLGTNVEKDKNVEKRQIAFRLLQICKDLKKKKEKFNQRMKWGGLKNGRNRKEEKKEGAKELGIKKILGRSFQRRFRIQICQY